jgi:hypothetical protein
MASIAAGGISSGSAEVLWKGTGSSGSMARSPSTTAGTVANVSRSGPSRRIERVVPTDGWFMAASDPETTLCSAPASSAICPPISASRTGTTSSWSPTT